MEVFLFKEQHLFCEFFVAYAFEPVFEVSSDDVEFYGLGVYFLDVFGEVL